MLLYFKRKNVHFFILGTLLILCVVYYVIYIQLLNSTIYCYTKRLPSLPSILDSRPAQGKSIFFHETSCNSERNQKIVINARQACAVESAAKLNQNFEIYLLYVSPGILKNEGTESDRFLQALQTYENVKIRHIDFEKYIEDTPVENLWKEGRIQKSYYVHSHASDVLRYLTLWKYGGVYLDLDVIVIQSLETLEPNYAGAQSDSLVAAGVLNFASIGSGHVLASNCLKDLRDNFNGKIWGRNGPDVITKLAQYLCGTDNIEDLIGMSCFGGFRVYPIETFYPISWQNWTMYFEEKYVKEVQERARNSYVLHFWNKLSEERKIRVGDEVAYSLFAKKFCPRVYAEVREIF